MNKKLRLLVTAKCHNKCPMCCNNQFASTRPERAEAPSPGHRPGYIGIQQSRPVRAKASQYQAFALTIIFALGKIKR